jgi:urease accessory protein
VISSAFVLVEAPGVLRRVVSAPPLTIRQVHNEDGVTCALCLVGSAAGPLPGDELTLRIDIADGARASLVAAGATIAQGQGVLPARLTLQVSVGAGAHLDADPGALIVCAGARVDVTVAIALAADATLRWREVVVLGRSGEPAGTGRLDWDVRRAGRPLLRQRVDLSDPTLTRWPGLLDDYRVFSSELRVDPQLDARTVVHHPAHVTQKLADHATLSTELTRITGRAAGAT